MLIKHKIPVFDVMLYISISDDIESSVIELEDIFKLTKLNKCSATVLHYYENFGVFFKTKDYDLNTVTHEIFHLTHRIFDYWSCYFEIENHEHFAMLHGYLSEKIFKAINLIDPEFYKKIML